MAHQIPIQISVEDLLTEAVVLSMLRQVGRFARGDIYTENGRSHVERKIRAYNHAAKAMPWLVVADLDRDACAPALIHQWLGETPRHPNLLLRLAVREIDAWILADRAAVADLLSIPLSKVPHMPDELQEPKECLIGLARGSRSRHVREGIVPAAGSTARQGPGYNSLLGQFVRNRWQLRRARRHSQSLDRAAKALEAFEATWAGRMQAKPHNC